MKKYKWQPVDKIGKISTCLIPICKGHGSMGQKNECSFYQMPMLPFYSSILRRYSMLNPLRSKITGKFLKFTSPACLNSFKRTTKLLFNLSLKVNKGRESIWFGPNQINSIISRIGINKVNIILITTRKHIRKGTS